MTTTSTLLDNATPTIRSAARALLQGIWTTARKVRFSVHREQEHRYKMRYDDLVGQPIHDEIRRAWWL